MDSNLKPKFEHSALEKDIERLAREVREHKTERPKFSEQEAVKSVLGTRFQQAIASPTTPPPQTQEESSILPEYLRQESPEVKLKVEELVDLAFHKGVETAVGEAKRYGPFILDSLHDALTAKVYDELKARNLL